MRFVRVIERSDSGARTVCIKVETVHAISLLKEEQEIPGGVFRGPRVEAKWWLNMSTASGSYLSTHYYHSPEDALAAVEQTLGVEIVHWREGR